MSFQVGAFCVNFGAAQEITVVGPPLLQLGIVSSRETREYIKKNTRNRILTASLLAQTSGNNTVKKG
jgi:hypothetical protein